MREENNERNREPKNEDRNRKRIGDVKGIDNFQK